MAESKGLDPDILVCLKQIIMIMKEDELSEVCIEQKDVKIQVRRMSDQPAVATQGMAMLEDRGEAAGPQETGDTSDGQVFVPAPMVGTFYRSPSPETKPYVNVGDEIEVGQVICIIDAMKLMNEITSDLDGEIVEILVEDGQPVEYDQPMFRVKPK